MNSCFQTQICSLWLIIVFFSQKVFKMLEGSDESVIAADDMRLAMANAFVVSI